MNKNNDHYPLPREIILRMASRPHRMHHYLWHQTRNAWARYTDSTRNELAELGWTPPRVHLSWDTNVILDNHAGEDFLFMHRQMIKSVNSMLKRITGDPRARVVGWSRLPRPDDAHYPVPPVYEHPNEFLNEIAAETKSEHFFITRMLYWERLFTDPVFLRSISLGVLGSMIESTIHDSMHMRWSSKPRPGIRLDPTMSGSPSPGQILNIDPEWDVPEYDFLGDEYSSHVNPIFWKIHGWVDDRISDWMIANGVQIGFHTGMPDPHWLGQWQGVLPDDNHDTSVAYSNLLLLSERMGRSNSAQSKTIDDTDDAHGHGQHRERQFIADLEKAMSIVLGSGHIHHMYSRTQGR